MLDKYLQAIEQWIRDGDTAKASEGIDLVRKKKLGRKERTKVAEFSRRINRPSVSLQLLSPYVRLGKSHLAGTALPMEILEYGGALLQIGSQFDAEEIIHKVDPETEPRAYYFQSSLLFRKWKYREAIPLLQKYLGSPGLSPYEKAVGELNLAACLVNQKKFEDCLEIIADLSQAVEKNKFQRLYANTLELTAQAHFLSGNFNKAEEKIKLAEKILGGKKTWDSLWIAKWKALTHLAEKPKSLSALLEVSKLKERARLDSHWDTVREMDRYEAIILHNIELAEKVYYGTPFESYRLRLKQDFGKDWSIPKTYLWQIGGGSENEIYELDLEKMTANGDEIGMERGQALHRLMTVLSSDFYRPFGVGALHSALYPGEYYNPITGPQRCQRLVQRFKQTLEKHKIPLSVETKNNSYKLVGIGNVSLRLNKEDSRKNPELRNLYNRFQLNPFKTLEVADYLNIPQRSANRFVATLLQQGLIEQKGSGRFIKYQIVKK